MLEQLHDRSEKEEDKGEKDGKELPGAADTGDRLRKFLEDDWGLDMFAARTNQAIDTANQAVEKLAEKLGCRFINVNQGLTDENGRLKKEFTIEGIHMYANAYRVILNNLKPYLQ